MDFSDETVVVRVHVAIGDKVETEMRAHSLARAPVANTTEPMNPGRCTYAKCAQSCMRALLIFELVEFESSVTSIPKSRLLQSSLYHSSICATLLAALWLQSACQVRAHARMSCLHWSTHTGLRMYAAEQGMC